jgi:hypothetical protein
LQAEVMSLARFDPTAIKQSRNNIWFVEDMTSEELHPQALVWIKQHARQVADFDVHVHARNFKMRVYLYDSVNRAARP